MPKAGFSAASQIESSLNFGEGWGEVVEIEAVVNQMSPNKTTGETYEPGTVVRMMIQRTDADGKHTTEDPIEETFGCGKLDKFHPGIIENAEDDEPEDQGVEVGAAGNCIWSDGSKINTKSKWGIFTAHLDKLGFKPAVLDAGYLPDIVGLKGYFTSIALPKDADRTYKRDPKALVMNKITRFPYEAKGKGAGGGKKDAATSASAAGAAAPKNGKASHAAHAQAEAAGGGDDVEPVAVQILLAIAKQNAGSTLAAAKLSGKLVTILNVGLPDETGKKTPVPTKQHKTVQGFFKNEAWLAEKCQELEYGFEDGVLSFPAAE